MLVTLQDKLQATTTTKKRDSCYVQFLGREIPSFFAYKLYTVAQVLCTVPTYSLQPPLQTVPCNTPPSQNALLPSPSLLPGPSSITNWQIPEEDTHGPGQRCPVEEQPRGGQVHHLNSKEAAVGRSGSRFKNRDSPYGPTSHVELEKDHGRRNSTHRHRHPPPALPRCNATLKEAHHLGSLPQETEGRELDVRILVPALCFLPRTKKHHQPGAMERVRKRTELGHPSRSHRVSKTPLVGKWMGVGEVETKEMASHHLVDAWTNTF